MQELKKKLVNYLSEDARYTVETLASMADASINEVAAAVKELEDDGTILKYTTIINQEKIDFTDVEALIQVKVKPQKLKGFDAVAEEFCSFSEVRSLYLMSGDYDLTVIVKGKNLNEIARFIAERLSTIDGVQSVATHFILKKYKIEGQTAIKINEPERQIVI